MERRTKPEVKDRRTVLVVDDELGVAVALRHVLKAAGYQCEIATDGTQAVEAVMKKPFDVVVTDIHMPGLSGLALLRALRAHDQDIPVILMTGDPNLGTAMEAISLGAMHYLAKPLDTAHLVKVVERASTLHELAKARRDAAALADEEASRKGDGDAELEASLENALDTMWMAFQPIVDTRARRVFGYEALMRTAEPSLPHPGAVLAAAERLDRLGDLGRRVRALSSAAFEHAPKDTLLFVNLHTCDLLDPDLFAESAPLTKIAERVVLEVTERASLEEVGDVITRVARLRATGFRVAIDDLGAGYAGLSSVVALEPDFVKLDMSLVRGIHASSIRQRVVGSLGALCAELGMRVLAEGIETPRERDAMHALKCELLQGYLFAKPGRPFPDVRWGP
jgi:EAL domain-containing protein (putative c-di-GMP-specific phosphodiesterase class I)